MFLTARWGELIGDIGRDAYWELADLKARLHPEDAPLLEAAMTHLLEGREQRAVVVGQRGQYQFMQLGGSGGCCHVSQFTQNSAPAIVLKRRILAKRSPRICKFCE